MKISNFAERELTEAELFTIERFHFYFDACFSFALVDTRTVVVIEKDGNVEQLVKEAKKLMRSCLNRHPDFETLYMDDKHGITALLNTVYTISETELSKEEQERERVDFVTALGLREDCHSACKKGQVLAIIEKEKEPEKRHSEPPESSKPEKTEEPEYEEIDLQKEIEKAFDRLYGPFTD